MSSQSKHIILDTCKKCGECVDVCPVGLFSLSKEEGLAVKPGFAELCITCGHCMAVCPHQAIVVSPLTYEDNFLPIEASDREYVDLFSVIFRRRSVRAYKDKPVSDVVIKQVLHAMSKAPMGFPPHKVSVTVATGRDKIEPALPLMVEMYKHLAKMMKNPLARFFIKRSISAETFASLENHVLPSLAKRLPWMEAGGPDVFTRGAPVLFLFHAPLSAESHTEDAMIMLTYGLLAAESLNMGASAISLIPPVVDRSQELRKLFRVPEGHQVTAAMIMGVPKYTYKRAILRLLPSVQYL